MPISSTPPSGFRDFLPRNLELRQKISQTISGVYRSFGFEPVETSALENLEVLTGKGGGENEKLIFKALKRGEKLLEALEKNEELSDMGLRFDLTLPLARFYAANQSLLPKPFKAFHIAPVWRAERAQKGRYREFTQCDLDIVGSDSWAAEVEIISAILEVFDALKIEEITVLLNDRSLVDQALSIAGVPEEKRTAACILIDKLDKVPREKIVEELSLLAGEQASKAVQALLLGDSENRYAEVSASSYARLKDISSGISRFNKNARIQITPSLMRGFDYYTGPVFEFRHPKLSGSLGGGGRYDRLLEKFGIPTISACGGSIGFERLILLLEELGYQKEDSGPKFFIAVFSDEMLPRCLQIAFELRALGQTVDLYPGPAKLKNQFKYADQKRARYALIIGPDEAKQNQIRIKDLKTGIEKLADFDSLANLPD